MHSTIYKINNKDVLYSTGNYIQYLIRTCNEKGSEKEHTCVHMCVTEPPCCTPGTNTHCELTTLWFFFKWFFKKENNGHICYQVSEIKKPKLASRIYNYGK